MTSGTVSYSLLQAFLCVELHLGRPDPQEELCVELHLGRPDPQEVIGRVASVTGMHACIMTGTFDLVWSESSFSLGSDSLYWY